MPARTKLAANFLAHLPGGPRLLRKLSGASASDAAPIFMLHRVLPDPAACYDPEMVVSTCAFEAFLAWVQQTYDVVPLEALPLTARKRRPSCAITFDDGWVDTYIHAFPRLHALHLPATVFLPVQFIGTTARFWQERLFHQIKELQKLPDPLQVLRALGNSFPWCPQLGAEHLAFDTLRSLLLRRSSSDAEQFVNELHRIVPDKSQFEGRAFINWDEVRQMQQGGIRFGSHTLQHTKLNCAAPGHAASELAHSRVVLREKLGADVTSFSYPWGAQSPFTRDQVADAGYTRAVTVSPGLCRADADPLRLPRIAISNAQLGWPDRARASRRPPAADRVPVTLQLHLARTRLKRAEADTSAHLVQNAGPATPRIRIGLLIDLPEAWADTPQGHPGGSEHQLARLMSALDSTYFDVELYYLRRPVEGLPRHSPWPCYAASPVNAGPLAIVLGMRRLLRERRPALVQATFSDETFLGIPAAWLAGVPAIHSARRNTGYWIGWFHRAGLRVINRMATSWQVNGKSVAAMLQAREGIPGDRIEILPNWLDLERFRPATPATRRAARIRLGLPEEAFITVSVANYREVKRLPDLIIAASHVCRQMPNAYFLLVGDGPERHLLRSLIDRTGLQERILLLGSLPNVEDYLAAANVGVLTSSSEGCSNAVLEYMAAGLPALITDIPANREVAVDGFVPVGDATALADALLKLAADPARCAECGRRNRERAEVYGGKAFADAVQEHYTRAAGIVGVEYTRTAAPPLGADRRIASNLGR